MPHKLQFKVIHASGQDDVYRAGELNHHSPLTKGWQSARFCLYPQDIVVQLEARSRLRKVQILSHQSLIPTKIEFFVGDVPEGIALSLDNVRYARLGYVSLSDNEKTGFKARELKSVHVDAVGQFLKLNVHKNHVNQHNLYNQVGIIAINIIGTEVRRNYDITDPDLQFDDTKLDNNSSLEGLFNKPDYISPLDDLAFDMYQDPEIAQIIRQLERKKQEAVLQERYDYAKQLKQAIEELQKVGEKLGKMDVEKRQAVESEDYDKARAKKQQMDEYRFQIYKELNLSDLLGIPGTRHRPMDLEPVPHLPRLEEPARTPPRFEERTLPLSSKAVSEHIGITVEAPTPAPVEDKSNSSPPSLSYDNRQLPVHGAKTIPIEIDPPPDSDQTQEVEPMSEVDLREASTAIDAFGLALVSKAYSKTWSYREDALTAIYRQLQEMATGNKEESKFVLRAAIFLVKRGIDDKVYAVFKAALILLKMILQEFVARHKVGKAEVSSAVERSLPNLFHKAGDTAARYRDDAKNFTLEMAGFPEVKPTQTVPHECVKPFKITLAPRHAQSRCELVESLYRKFGLKNGLTMENVMTYNVQSLQHNSGEVRDVVERLIKQMYQDHGAPVKDYLPPDDEKTRKNTLWRQLFEFFDQVDGKPSKSELKKLKAGEEQKKQAEIDDLQKQLQQLRDMNAGKASVHTSPVKNEPSKKSTQTVLKKKSDGKANAKTKPAKDDDEVSLFNMDNTCIFCGEKNENFTEEGLDLHYWRNCPMLKRCANCKQVVEIATYTDHMLTECEAKSNFSKCPRCTEAVNRVEFDQHVADKACSQAKSGQNHCSLCHENFQTGEEGWKDHLMSKTGCKQNPRRLASLNKPPATTAGSKSTTNKRGGKTGAGRGRK